MIVASIDKEVVIMTHQNLNLGMCWKLFWATLNRLFSVTVSHNRWKDTPAVWRFAIRSQVPSSLSAGYQHLSQDLAETSPAFKLMSAKEQAHYFSSCTNHFTASSLPIRNALVIVKRLSWCLPQSFLFIGCSSFSSRKIKRYSVILKLFFIKLAYELQQKL